MSGLVAEPGRPEGPGGRLGPERAAGRLRTALRAIAFGLAASGLGALAGVLWWAVVDLPGYTVGSNGGASTSERGLTEFVGGDAWFALIGLVAGIVIGSAAWRLFGGLGWPVVLIAIGSGLVAALLCWVVGYRLGPGPFPPRLGAARTGDVVPIELTVRARPALLVWAFGAVLPILLAASLGRDDEEPRPSGRRRRRGASD